MFSLPVYILEFIHIAVVFFYMGVFFCQLRLLMTLDSSRVATLVVSVVLIIYGSFRYVHYRK